MVGQSAWELSTGAILYGHGCFGKYLCRIGREPTTDCHKSGWCEDKAQHTLEVCPAWSSERRDLAAAVGDDLSVLALIKSLMETDKTWAETVSICERMLS